MNDEQIAKMTAWKLLGQTSCIGCKFLYFHDTGYSNYTVENTDVCCAKEQNPNLPADLPYDWGIRGEGQSATDNWPKTANSRCAYYAPGVQVHLDVDGEHNIDGEDAEADEAISQHSGRPIKAQRYGEN